MKQVKLKWFDLFFIGTMFIFDTSEKQVDAFFFFFFFFFLLLLVHLGVWFFGFLGGQISSGWSCHVFLQRSKARDNFAFNSPRCWIAELNVTCAYTIIALIQLK